MDGNKKVTIIDVAELAGVSKGTVDRVVHNRGEVSKKSAEKVRKAIEQLNYQPNLYASMLASRKVPMIALLIPKFAEGEYWEKLSDGFLRGGETATTFKIETRIFKYDQYSLESFRAACSEVLDAAPDGVVFSPFFKNDSALFVSSLAKAGIPYVYVDTKLEDDRHFASFGMPMYKSGSLCAHLLTERCRPEEVDEIAIVRITHDKSRQADPTVNRREGFLDYIGQNFPDCQIHNVFINPSRPGEIYDTLDAFFGQHPNVRYVVMLNSRVYLIGDYLAKNPVEGRRVIGFDALDRNVECLKNGSVQILIAQHTEDQSYLAVMALVDWLLFQKRPQRQDNFMHMDILSALNVENY